MRWAERCVQHEVGREVCTAIGGQRGVYSIRWAERCVQHEAKLSAMLASRPCPECCSARDLSYINWFIATYAEHSF